MLSALALSSLQVSLRVGVAAPKPQEGQAGTRQSGVRPKRQTTRRPTTAATARPQDKAATAGGSKTESSLTRASKSLAVPELMTSLESLVPPLATADFDLVGLAVTVSPATQTVPKNTPSAVLTSVKVPEGTDPSLIIAGINPNYRVRGELTGQSMSSPLTVEASIGQPLPIPPLSRAGDHLLQNLRVVDTGAEGEPVVASVAPDACGIVVIERLFISEVRVNELTYDQIIQAGINITDDSYQAFNFTLGLGTTSDAQSISIPVAFPNVGVKDQPAIVGLPTINAPGLDVPTVVPIMLTGEVIDGHGEVEEGNGGKPPTYDGEPVRIPGVIVFPGRVGFLHQFFEAIVIVANGAPNGTPLVLANLRARAKLPDNGTPSNADDDPLRIAEMQTGGRLSELALHGLGPDSKYGTPDDTNRFSPGQSGQATFLLEGLKEGLHTVNFDLTATLEGLPSGSVNVRGEVPGVVLVRDASFAVSFTHPAVVRAGQQYDLAMTLYNSGGRDIQGAFAKLNAHSISGAELLGDDTGQRPFANTIRRGDSSTVKWRLRSNTTGAVTASYLKVGDGVSAGLALVTGVGDRNVPLSPDSLILPDPVRHLPPDVVEAARAMLGQAWSIANAPPGSLPPGVKPTTKQVVVERAIELGIAGMRVDFGEPSSVALQTLMRDWLGELQPTPDEGFADALRNTTAGDAWYDAVGAEFYRRLNSVQSSSTPIELHQEFSNTESSRSQFISALVTHADGQSPVGAQLIDAQNHRVGFGATPDERTGDLPFAGTLRLMRTDVMTGASSHVGQMLIVSKPDAGLWTLELNGWKTGSVDLSLLVPGANRTYRQIVWSGLQIVEGGKYRVGFKTSSTGTPVLEEWRDGAYQTSVAAAPTSTTLGPPAARLVGVIQVTPDVVAGGDKYGRLLGLLFSRPVLKTSAETISRYRIEGGALKGSSPAEIVGGEIKVTGARADYGDRFVFLGLDSTIGPYIERSINVAGLMDAQRNPVATLTAPVAPRVSPEGVPPGAYLTGRVVQADGTPVAGAQVMYWSPECAQSEQVFPSPPRPIALRTTDTQGRYAIDYVRDGDCGSLSIRVRNPLTQSEKSLSSPVAYDGQHLVFDMVFLARGNVQGTVTSGGQTVPNAFVRVVPDLDVVGTKVVQADDRGRYTASDVPVGNVSVTAIGTGNLASASGLAAGTITGAGQTSVINVSLQDVSGVVRGRVVRPDNSAAVGQLVVAYARIPGFNSNRSRADGASAVGYSFADREGNFQILNLPVGDVIVEATDYLTGLLVTQRVQLTPTSTQISDLIIILPGFGTVTGRVMDEQGNPVPRAVVGGGGGVVRADDEGNYTLRNLLAGTHTVTASNPDTGMSGSAIARVRSGETASNVNISIFRPATLEGTLSIVEEGTTTPKPVAGAKVSVDGIHIADTDEQGRYTLTNITPNSELILRFVETEKKLVINMPVFLASGETLSRSATFRPASLHGKVFQPDGITPTLAQVEIHVPSPVLGKGGEFGLIDTEARTLQTPADGSYSLTGLNPGAYRVSASNVFFPTRVSQGGTLVPHGNDECNLVLVSTLAGKIQGRVFQPDGITPVGQNIRVTLGGGSLAAATVTTDANGRYEFGEVFSAGSYQLTAIDPATGNANRIFISVERNKDAVADLRLLGTGGLRVNVIDGAGHPVRSGSIRLDGTDYPNAHRFAEITPDSNGIIEFDNLPEGSYAVAASERGLGGRTGVVVPLGATVEATIQLQASGTVKGRVSMPGGTMPVGLADVELRLGGRPIGFTVTLDAEPEAGTFTFLNVPTGDFTLDVFDNRTGRVGRSAGRVTEQGQVVIANVELLLVGAVAGRVTANGAPVAHALVQISADGSGIRGAYLRATTDPEGRYRFTGIPAGRFGVSVSDTPGGQTGYASGSVAGTVEPLEDAIVDIALEPSQTLTGTVYRAGGSQVVPGAQVSIRAGNRDFRTATNERGVYRLGFVPLGELRVRAEAPTGYERGEAAPVIGTQAGSTVVSNVTLDGTGTVTGEALDSTGVPLANGALTLTNDAWGTPVVMLAALQPDGRFEFTGVPVGHFTLRLTVPNRIGVGTAAADVVSNQTTNIPVRLEDAGKVVGRVKSPDGAGYVTGADIILSLHRANDSFVGRFYTHSDSQGAWGFDNLPLGSLSISISDIASGGVASAGGVSLSTNGQVVDVGELTLDNTPIRISSITPNNGALDVPTGASVAITFSERAAPSSVNAGSIRLQQSTGEVVPITLALSGDGQTATLTPSARLADKAAYTVVINTAIEDMTGHRLATEYRSSFVTADETAPAVSNSTPSMNAVDVASETAIVISFNEPLDRAQDFDNILKVVSGTTPGEAVTGILTLDETGHNLTFKPSVGLPVRTRYTITVTGQRDPAGNAQTAVVTFTFTTLNLSPSVTITAPLEGAQLTEHQTVELAATATDDGQITGVVFSINGTVSSPVNAAPYTHSYTVPEGITSLEVAATATDELGKTATAVRTFVVVRDLGGTVTGIVSDQSNRPASAARVRLTASNGAFDTTTDADGRYRFDPVALGNFVVAATDESNSFRGKASGTIQSASETLELNIRLAPSGTVTGIVFQHDGVTPVIGADVSLYSPAFGGSTLIGSTMTDAAGRYTIEEVPLGNFNIEVSHAPTGDRGRASNQVNANAETRTINVTLNGIGRVVVTVVNNSSIPVGGASVRLTSESLGGNEQTGTTQSDGTVTFEKVLAGNFSASSTDLNSRLSGLTSGILTANGEAQVTIRLEPSGTIRGRVLDTDGATPVGGLKVRLLDASRHRTEREVVSDSDGNYSFEAVPLRRTYSLDVLDASSRVRAVRSVSLSGENEVQTRDLVLVGLGGVVGRVLNLDGTPAPNLDVRLRSLNTEVGGFFNATTNEQGNFSFAAIPTGQLTVTAIHHARQLQGENSGQLTADGQVVTVNVQLVNNSVGLPVVFYDANNFFFDVYHDGSTASGLNDVYKGDFDANRGGFLLDVIAGGTVNHFIGGSFGTTEGDGREVALRQQNLAGLDVTRKVYVPPDGYFARYLEILHNPSSSPVTVDLRVQSNIKAGHYFNGNPHVVSTSSGDSVLDVAATTNPDRWVVVNDDLDSDPFKLYKLPAIGFAFDGQNGATRAGAAGYTGFDRGQVTYLWNNVTIEPGATVSYLHFGVQQMSNAAAAASVERLVQLPPEALAGMSEEEIAGIRNFAVPANGMSRLDSLPALTGSINGRVLASDNTSIVANSTVTFKSNQILFSKTRQMSSDDNGRFTLSGSVNKLQGFDTVAVPVSDFTLVASHPVTALVSPETVGSFAASEINATKDVVFSNSGILRGTVRRHNSDLFTQGQVVITRANPYVYASINIASDGTYKLTGLAAGSYNIDVWTSVNVSPTEATVSAGQVTVQDILLPPTGGVQGTVRDGADNPAANVYVRLSDTNLWYNKYERFFTTDANGHYEFADIPVGNYFLTAYEPRTGVTTAAQIRILAEQTITQDIALIGFGQVELLVTFADGTPAPASYVEISEAAKGTFRYVGNTNTQGRLTIDDVPVGGFTLRVSHPNASSIKVTAADNLPGSGMVVSKTVALPGTGLVKGRVSFADGTPAPNALVEIFGTGVGFPYTYTDSNGNYTLNQVQVGRPFTVRGSSPNDENIRREVGDNIIHDNGGTLIVDIALPSTSTLRVNVLREDATPFPNAQIFIQDGRWTSLAPVGKTDATGILLVNNVPEGVFKLVALDTDGGLLNSTTGTLTQNDVGHIIDITLQAQPPGNVHGKVLIADGQTPLTHLQAGVELYDIASGMRLGVAYTDYNDASFQWQGVRGGEQGFKLVVHSPFNYYTIAETTGKFTSPNQTLELNVQLPVSMVKGMVRFADGSPVPYPFVYMTANDGSDIYATYYTNINDALGNYTIFSPATGAFELIAQDPDSGLTTDAGGNISDLAVPVNLDLSMPPVGNVKGRVTAKDASGNTVGVAGANVTLISGEGLYERGTTADADGNYNFKLVQLGEFTAKAEAPHNAGLSGRATGRLVNPGDTTTADITLPESGTVSGTVFRVDGTTPVVNASVVISSPALDYHRSTQTDGNGFYSFTGIPLDTFAIQAADRSTPRYKFGSAGGVLASANTTALVNITMLASATVSGRILDASGAPMPGVDVRVQNFSSVSDGSYFHQDLQTDANGRYEATGVPVGLIRVSSYQQPAEEGANRSERVSRGLMGVDSHNDGSRREAGFRQGLLTTTGLGEFDVMLGNAVGLAYNLDGADGFRYDVGGGGAFAHGGTVDGSLQAYSAGQVLVLNGNDYVPRLDEGVLEANGRQVVVGQTGLDNLYITRKIYSPAEGRFARFLEVLTNPTNADINVNVRIEHNLSSDSRTRVVVSPSSTGNHYAVTDNSFGSEKPALADVFGGPGAAVPINAAYFINGYRYAYYNWNVTIPAGQTRIIMHYAVQRPPSDTAGARAQAEALVNLSDAKALEGMTAGERAQVVNFNIP